MNTKILSPNNITQVYSQSNKLLGIYTYFRLILASVLLSLYKSGISQDVLGSLDPELFSFTCHLYIALSITALIYLSFRKFRLDEARLFVFQFFDICILTTLMHASGGVGSGIGYLLMFVVAMSSLLLRMQLGLLIAALTSILVIGENISLVQKDLQTAKGLFSSGTLGILLFGSALLFSNIAQRLTHSQEETRVQVEETKHLQKLSQSILERMQTGVIVVDKSQQVILMNNAAGLLLFDKKDNLPVLPFSINRLPAIHQQLLFWQKDSQTKQPDISAEEYGQQLHISFAQLESHDQSDILIFLEETRRISQRAQQLKLASLGRLTASIAHEIRNPVGAISHAAQLLSETLKEFEQKTQQEDIPHQNKEYQKLSSIIHKHTIRVNDIIENVLQLSRRKISQPESIILEDWLNIFIKDFKESYADPCQIQLSKEAKPVNISIDPSHFRQVLTNLCENALRYSKENSGTASVYFEIEIDTETELPYLHVMDDGPGISPKNQGQLFEPFFTTENTGTGLGLYLAKELCLANQANLFYQERNNKSCFTISFAHPERQL